MYFVLLRIDGGPLGVAHGRNDSGPAGARTSAGAADAVVRPDADDLHLVRVHGVGEEVVEVILTLPLAAEHEQLAESLILYVQYT